MTSAVEIETNARIRQRYEQIADQLVAELRAGRLSPGDRLPAERELAQRFAVGRASVREALGSLQVRGVVETRPGSGSFVADDALERVDHRGDGSAVLDLPADTGPSAVLEARAILEPAVARLAAERAGGSGGGTAGRPGPNGGGGTADPAIDRLLDVMADSADPADPEQRRRWSDADRMFHRQIAVTTGNPVLIAVADHLAALMDEPLWRRLRDDSIAAPGRTTLQLAEHRLIAAAISEGDADAAEQLARDHVNRARRYMALD